MKKQHLFKYRLYLAVFYTRQSRNDGIDVIVTSLWIRLLLFREILFHSTSMLSLVVIRQQVKEKQKGHNVPPPPPAYMVPKYPSLNRVNYLHCKALRFASLCTISLQVDKLEILFQLS